MSACWNRPWRRRRPRLREPRGQGWAARASWATERRSGADPDESEGLIDHIRSIEPVIVACVFEEVEPNVIRISLRSKCDDVDVSEIAQQFGGGGHKASAGARIQGTPLSVQRKMVQALRKALDRAFPESSKTEDASTKSSRKA